ncbi:sugar ABC transporter substrate-binding protein (plasmid) [Rhizobium phaseoli]|uniref:Putative sugar ABC transporter, substrate-binding protein n=1 Tax=Rhizobium etli (strain CIAT 652) TaxID=491916 RepID=B3Q4E4_RHIE6|nr:extracellular solute-binding protein [Rhizobium phaseoli]ACE95051.1 putative sugar ABC transporter, substrate-binding protein [Rhizobium etli CIAT 652]MDH6645648.1 multiple sugar transport system substrate-binding protein [Rhizobium esperanzae]ANL32123.1 sugar ABC transporter substrate-binding protein [Rhizobium phaseoli]ARM15999.1 sugar ABC transporter substrate-binding protein [Rhizobium phaseoli Brasil 5]MDK4727659.1 extracellular solute-binding protein [Rhizobium phaseoli]
MKSATVSALTLSTVLFSASTIFAQELATKDRIGLADAPKTLVVRLTNDSPNNSDPAIAEGYQKIFVDFIKKHPDWKLQMQFMSSDIGTEQAKMLEQAKAGNAPDCAAVDSFVLSQFMVNHVLADFTPYFSKEEVDDLFPFIRAGITDKDKTIRAWWWDTDLRVLYRNKSIVSDAPATWDDLKKAAIASTKEGMEGVLFNGGRWEGTTFDWLANYWALGGKLVDDSGKPVFGEGENKEKFLKALNYFKDLVDSGAAPKRVSTIANYDDMNAAAAAGTTALFIGGNWQYAQLKATLDEDEFKNWTFSPIPGPSADQRSTGTGGWTIASFSKDKDKIEMCANLARDVYMGPGNALQQQLPTRKSLFDKYEVFSTEANKTFANALVDGQARPGVPIYPEISNQIQIMMGDVLSGTKKPEEALDAAFSAAMEAYKRL